MLPKPNRVQKVARIISDPVVNFVSLVSHAANQTPFKVIKSEDENAQMDDTAKQLLGKSTTVISVDITRPETDAVLAQKVEFDSANFDQARAETTLKELGFSDTDYILTQTDTMLIAKSIYFDEFDSENIGKIDANVPGMRMFVGKLAKADNDSNVSEDESVARSAKTTAAKVTIDESKVPLIKGIDIKELVQKYDYYATWWSDDTTLAGVLKDGMSDGTPPGAFEVGDAFWRVVANCVCCGDMAGITKAAADMGSLIVALTQLFTDLTNSEDEGMQKMAKEALDKLTKTEEQTVETTTATEEVVESTPESTTTETTEVSTTEPTTEVATEPVVETAENTVEQEPTPAEPTTEQKSAIDVVASVESLLKGFKDDITTAFKEHVSETESRIQRIEGTASQKRSIEPTGEETGKIAGANSPSATQTQPALLKADPRLSAIIGI